MPPSCVIGSYVQPHQQDFSTIFCGNVVIESAKCSYSYLADEELLAHPPLSSRLLLYLLSLNSPSGVCLPDLQFPCLVKYHLKLFILSFAFTKGVNAFLNFEKNQTLIP